MAERVGRRRSLGDEGEIENGKVGHQKLAGRSSP
jgi:hypothetical protein